MAGGRGRAGGHQRRSSPWDCWPGKEQPRKARRVPPTHTIPRLHSFWPFPHRGGATPGDPRGGAGFERGLLEGGTPTPTATGVAEEAASVGQGEGTEQNVCFIFALC